jgi:hypothetical protein
MSAFLVALGAVPLLFFAGYLRAGLRHLHPSGRLSANVALAGAVVAATGLAVQSLIHAALAEAAQTSEFSGQALQSLNALDGWSFYPARDRALYLCIGERRGSRARTSLLRAVPCLGCHRTRRAGARSGRRILRRDSLRNLGCGHQPDAVRTIGGHRSPVGGRGTRPAATHGHVSVLGSRRAAHNRRAQLLRGRSRRQVPDGRATELDETQSCEGAAVCSVALMLRGRAAVSAHADQTAAPDDREVSAGPWSAPAPHSHSSTSSTLDLGPRR